MKKKLTYCLISTIILNILFLDSVRSETPQKIDWDKTPYNLSIDNKVGRKFSFVCKPNGEVKSVAGTDLYTYDSSICTAAAHKGLITVPSGGKITILIRPGNSFYNGTVRNDISSTQEGERRSSFVFVGSNGQALISSESAYQLINWDKSPYNLGIDNRLNQKFTFICRSNGEIKSIAGTDLYTYDSSICTAAAHQGIITVPDGGKVTVQIKAGSNFYNGTKRNGIQSSQENERRSSFIIIESPKTSQNTVPENEIINNSFQKPTINSDLSQNTTSKIDQTCKVTDPTGTPLNLRDNPSGNIIGQLDNGREIYILEVANDKRNRTWAKVAGYEDGQYKTWGWGIRKFISC
jgi:LCCL domain